MPLKRPEARVEVREVVDPAPMRIPEP